MRSRDEQIEIANTIIKQLGGHRFVVMTGAKHIFAHESGVSFRVPGTMTKNRINYVKITLNTMDTYDIEFKRIYGLKVKDISDFSGAYCDMLQEVFTKETGLNTHL
uniref:Uncharacterized protein n=1 Tax=viral metagenome TaxID=1070528 RepID=A0A6M3LQV5_9ZZZZ